MDSTAVGNDIFEVGEDCFQAGQSDILDVNADFVLPKFDDLEVFAEHDFATDFTTDVTDCHSIPDVGGTRFASASDAGHQLENDPGIDPIEEWRKERDGMKKRSQVDCQYQMAY